MDGSAFRNLDLGGLFWWAIVGMGLTALLTLGGAVWLVVFLINHVSFH